MIRRADVEHVRRRRDSRRPRCDRLLFSYVFILFYGALGRDSHTPSFYLSSLTPISSLPSSLSETVVLGSSPPLSRSTSGALPLVKGAASTNDESRALKKANGSLYQVDQGRGAALVSVNSRVALISSAARKAENADRITSAQRIKRLLSIQRLLQAERLGQQMTYAEDAAHAQSSVSGPVVAPTLLPQQSRGQLGLPPASQAVRESQPSRTSTPRTR